MEKSTKVKQNFISKKNTVRAGEFWSINTVKSRGHKSLITKRRKNGVIEHIPTTHHPTTRRMNNIPLEENPQPDDKTDAYMLPRVEKTTIKHLGKYHKDMKIKNATDKSVARHLKKQNKKR